MTAAEQCIREEIRRHGVLPFSRFMELALYAPGLGYYERPNGRIGRRGDFYTSVSVGPALGRLLSARFAKWARQFDAVDWVEAGAHDGQLAADILEALESEPALLDRLRYWIVEPSEPRRQEQVKRLERWSGQVQWRERWNDFEHPIHGIIFANELLDALPCARYGWNAAERRWFEWGVTVEAAALTWVRMEGQPTWWTGRWRALEEVLPDGYVIEDCPAAVNWWRTAAGALGRGWLVTLDYGDADGPIVRPERAQGTLRAYSRHRVSDDLLGSPGEQDLTAHVSFARIVEAGESLGLTTVELLPQGRWLGKIATEQLAEGGPGADWLQRHTRQLQTLIHPGHLGQAFKVLVQARDGDPGPPSGS
ncbi:MAG: SAM-dependent methyltransferase [Verrucomicrobiales bacterium]|nr:SAM-dependent methyltransferase [Verrucomicrobiales bacterium]